MNVLCNPRFTICIDECTLVSEVVLDICLCLEIFANDGLFLNKQYDCLEHLYKLYQIIRSPRALCQTIKLQKLTVSILQNSAFILHDICTNTSEGNKQMYIVDKRSCYMLKLAAKFGSVDDLLYIAMIFYQTFRNREALSVIEMTKVKLAQPGLMHNGHVDPERYTEAVGGLSWSYKMRMRHNVADVIDQALQLCLSYQ